MEPSSEQDQVPMGQTRGPDPLPSHSGEGVSNGQLNRESGLQCNLQSGQLRPTALIDANNSNTGGRLTIDQLLELLAALRAFRWNTPLKASNWSSTCSHR